MAIGSLAEAANQKGDFAQNAAKNAGVNLAAQGVLSAAAKGIGRGITAIKVILRQKWQENCHIRIDGRDTNDI